MNADELRASLERLKLLQTELADATGYDKRTIRKWVGKTTAIPPAVAILIRGLRSRKFNIDDVRRWKC